ncbi:MAG: DNA starvation/stationary phase protection protein [Gammaproteobacteria bacterium]|nr:DNA starvation/stationary phase protection protein [Gammaproteobacteria bacterium]
MKEDYYQAFARLMADTYTLYLKTQNYHWHVRGPHFKTLHLMFEEQYTQLALGVDALAERILTLGHSAPATFAEFSQLRTLEEGDSKRTAEQMVAALCQDHQLILKDLYKVLKMAQELNDEGSTTLLGDRIAEHEKTHWMLKASQS